MPRGTRRIIIREKQKFRPNHEYIKNAVSYFLKNGGTIKKIKPDDSTFEQFIRLYDSQADDFLRG